MPRTPSPHYYESRKAYYVKYHGRQHLLAAGPKDEPDGPTYKLAIKRFAQLMHADEVEHVEDECRISAVITRYYRHLENEGRQASLDLARRLLDSAVLAFGHVKVRELKPFAVTDWLASRDTWNETSKSRAISNLITAFNWAKREGTITKNPIAGYKKPEEHVRGTEYVIPDELQAILIDEANPALARVLHVLRETGARPGEILHAECDHYRADIGAIVHPWNPPRGKWRWKNGKKTKRDRIIYLPPESQAIVEEEIARRGGRGRIFLTLRGKEWYARLLNDLLDILVKKAAVRKWCKKNHFDPDKILPYGFRHAYITRMLLSRCSVKVLADLCGTSIMMIERVYSHAHDDLHAMRQLALQFSSASPSAAASPPPQSDPSRRGGKR
jgi:integrase